ncbi:MAG: acetyltransferase [Bacteroidales bacterium]|nr:acetyltransferase [Lachnoclostridium sp.]MCM1383948.1 acetyltransferase [Lachnoclostridium sp.]MCM1464657.1 acetyltransferase [Bacteroidales bacterium]
MDKIIILGNGGHAASIVDALERQNQYEIAGYIVGDGQGTGDDKYPVLGNDDCLEKIFREGIHNAAVGIGFMGKSDLRERLWATLKQIGFTLPVICDPSAILAKNACIGEGSFIGKRAVLNANVSVGKMGIINTGAIIEHDCKVGDFSHVSVGSVLCGNVQIGQSTFVGANATVIQGKVIGNRCIVAAGMTIRKNVEDDSVAFSRETRNIYYSRGGSKP